VIHFSTPALKELGRGQPWFIILIVKTRCTHADKTFWFPLDHHQQSCLQHMNHPPPSTSVSVLDRSLTPSLEKPDESLALIKGPMADHPMVMRRSSLNLIQAHHLLLAKLIISNTWIGTTRTIKPMARSFSK